MCEICGHPSPDTNNIDDLLEAYERQQREVYINRTIPGINKLSDIAYRLADAYEMEYRANPTYENEELIRKHREATKPTNEEHPKKKRTLTNDELNAFLFIGLTGSMIATPIFAMIFLYLVVGPR